MVDVLLLSLVIVYLLWRRYAFWKRAIYPEKVRASMYPFYKVRDNLLRLQAQGVIKSDGAIFTTFYEGANNVLYHFEDSRKFSLRRLLEYAEDINTDEIKSNIRVIKKEYSAIDDQELNDTLETFFEATILLILKNSKFFIAGILTGISIGIIQDKIKALYKRISRTFSSIDKFYSNTTRVQAILQRAHR